MGVITEKEIVEVTDIGKTVHEAFLEVVKRYDDSLKMRILKLREQEDLYQASFSSFVHDERKIQKREKKLIEYEHIQNNFDARFKEFCVNGKNLQKFLTDLNIDEERANLYFWKMIGKSENIPSGLSFQDVHDDLLLELQDAVVALKSEQVEEKRQLGISSAYSEEALRRRNHSLSSIVLIHRGRSKFFEYFQKTQEQDEEYSSYARNDWYAALGSIIYEKDKKYRLGGGHFTLAEIVIMGLSYPEAYLQGYDYQDHSDLNTFLKDTLGIDTSRPNSLDDSLLVGNQETTEYSHKPVSTRDEINTLFQELKLPYEELTLKELNYIYDNGNVASMREVYDRLRKDDRTPRSISKALTCLVRIQDASWIDTYHDICSKEQIALRRVPLARLDNPESLRSNIKSFKDAGYNIGDMLDQASSILFCKGIDDVQRKLNLLKKFHISKVQSKGINKKDSAYSLFNLSFSKLVMTFLTAEEEGISAWYQQTPSLTVHGLSEVVGLHRYCSMISKDVESDRDGHVFRSFIHSKAARRKELPGFTKEMERSLVPDIKTVAVNTVETFDNKEEVELLTKFYRDIEKTEKPQLTPLQEENYQRAMHLFETYQPALVEKGYSERIGFYEFEKNQSVYDIDGVKVSYARIVTTLPVLATMDDFNPEKALAACIFIGSVHSKDEMEQVKSEIVVKENQSGTVL